MPADRSTLRRTLPGQLEATTRILFLGLIPGAVAIKLIATLECFIGVCLLSGRWLRLAI